MSYYTDYSNYTDFHGVDEDERTIVNHGGDWTPNLWAGVMYRDVLHSPSYHADYVASRCCTIQKK